MILPFLRPIEPFLLDPEVNEIMVNGPERVFIERQGYLEAAPGVVFNERSLLVAVKNIARRLGATSRRRNPSSIRGCQTARGSQRSSHLPGGCICRKAGRKTPGGVSRRGCRRRLASRPNRLSPCNRFAGRWKRESPGRRCWAMRGMETILSFASVTGLSLRYVLGVTSSTTVWKPGEGALPKKPWSGRGQPPKRLRRDPNHPPVSVLALAQSLPKKAWKNVTWREGTKHSLRSRFAWLRVRPAHRDEKRIEPRPEEWLLIEWPKGEGEPSKYWLSTLPVETKIQDLVRLAKQRWIIERDYQELK